MSEENVKVEVAERVYPRDLSDFEKELSHIINKYSKENMSDTPDFILANYLSSCLINYSIAVSRRDKWFNVNMWNKEGKTKEGFTENIQKEMEILNKKT